MAKLTEAKEDAVTGNVFVPKIPYWLLNRERTERMPAQGGVRISFTLKTFILNKFPGVTFY